MVLEVVQTQELCQISSPQLRLRFHRHNDRWHHAILLCHQDGAEWESVLESVEGNAADAIPPSPALQDCFLQEIAPGIQEVQLMGQSGKVVYSAAVRFDGTVQEIAFDLCLRTALAAGVPNTLSTYRFGPDVRSTPRPDSGHVTFLQQNSRREFPQLRWEIQPPAQSPAIAFEKFSDTESLHIPGNFAEELPTGTSRRSYRWRYCLRLGDRA